MKRRMHGETEPSFISIFYVARGAHVLKWETYKHTHIHTHKTSNSQIGLYAESIKIAFFNLSYLQHTVWKMINSY